MEQPQRAGILAKRSPKGLKQYQNRYCVLSDGVLRYFKDKSSAKKKKIKGELKMQEATIDLYETKGKRKWAFGITAKDEKRTFVFAAIDEVDRKLWVADLKIASTFDEAKQRKARAKQKKTDKYLELMRKRRESLAEKEALIQIQKQSQAEEKAEEKRRSSSGCDSESGSKSAEVVESDELVTADEETVNLSPPASPSLSSIPAGHGDWVVVILIKSGRNMAVMDSNGLSDPYVNVQLNDVKKTKIRSKIVFKSLNPVFQQEFKFLKVGATDVVNFYVKDDDGKFQKAEPLGQVCFPLVRVLEEGNDRQFTLHLTNVPPNKNDGKIPDSTLCIHVKLMDGTTLELVEQTALSETMSKTTISPGDVDVRSFVSKKMPSRVRGKQDNKTEKKTYNEGSSFLQLEDVAPRRFIDPHIRASTKLSTQEPKADESKGCCCVVS